jgi:hypothetical protein
MKKRCKICSSQFEAVRSAVTCSKECSAENKRINKKVKPSREGYKNKILKVSEQLGLPKYYVKQYSAQFLLDNPLIVESLKIQYFMTGQLTDLPQEIVEIRKRARKTPLECNREKFVPKVRKCKICGGDYTARYTGSGGLKTCSDKCADELRVRTIEANRLRNKGKKYNVDKEKARAYYEKTWAIVNQIAKERGVTTREARKLMVKEKCN